MVDRINRLYGPQGVSLDFARDVLPLSMYHDGGTVTERHLMLALARQLLRLQGGPKAQPGTYAAMLEEFDLVGRLKQECIPRVYIDAREECPLLSQCIQFAREMGCILAYSYLGDVTVSVTGDKKPRNSRTIIWTTCLRIWRTGESGPSPTPPPVIRTRSSSGFGPCAGDTICCS